MTRTRKLSIAATALVIGAALVVWAARKRPPPIAVSFLRYAPHGMPVLQITNLGSRRVVCVDESQQDISAENHWATQIELEPHKSENWTLLLLLETSSARVTIKYTPFHSGIRRAAVGVIARLGFIISDPELDSDHEDSVEVSLPPPKPPSP